MTACLELGAAVANSPELQTRETVRALVYLYDKKICHLVGSTRLVATAAEGSWQAVISCSLWDDD